MKDRQTQRAVKNILHNELGITNEKVEQLITDYVDKKMEQKLDAFMNSRHFEYLVEKRIEKTMTPLVTSTLRPLLNSLSVKVNMTK